MSRGSFDMTTPAAWVLECLVVPSTALAESTSFLTPSSASYISRSSSLSSMAVSSFMLSRLGTSRATLSTSS